MGEFERAEAARIKAQRENPPERDLYVMMQKPSGHSRIEMSYFACGPALRRVLLMLPPDAAATGGKHQLVGGENEKAGPEKPCLFPVPIRRCGSSPPLPASRPVFGSEPPCRCLPSLALGEARDVADPEFPVVLKQADTTAIRQNPNPFLNPGLTLPAVAGGAYGAQAAGRPTRND